MYNPTKSKLSMNKYSSSHCLALIATILCSSCLSHSTMAFAPISRLLSHKLITTRDECSKKSRQLMVQSKSFSSAGVSPSSLLFSVPTSAESEEANVTTEGESMDNDKVYKPIFDFMIVSNNITTSHPINKFERIDDAIMGGISTSTLRFVPNKPYCSWSGVCREFGGGFCGMRTLPFVEPLQITDPVTEEGSNRNGTAADGVFVSCRLASDDEPERRVWKMTIRTDTSRGELVYQSSFQLPKSLSEEEWHTIHVPFDSFKQVRGPRIVMNGEKLDLTNGIYQIGMTMSKFQMGLNTTEIENFRAGYFELQIQQIGLYFDKDEVDNDIDKTKVDMNASSSSFELQTLTKDEMMKKRKLVFKILIAMSKIFFSEQANRRKSAMNILREKRKMTRLQAIMFGVRNRSKSIGLVGSIAKTASIITIDAFRTVLKSLLKIVLIYPVQLIRKTIRLITKTVTGKDTTVNNKE